VRRAPKPLFERLKLPLLLAAFIAVSEYVDPLPFKATLPAKIAVALLIMVVFREFHHAALETDDGWVARTRTLSEWWRRKRATVSREAWLKFQRVVVWVSALLTFGALLNVLTDRCDSALQCVVLAPRMAVENLPTFLQFAVYMTLSLFQIAFMFYALIKVGSFKVVMPGTIDVTFDDVWGQDAAKAKVLEQVRLLEDSEDVEAAGGYMPRGILLYGPPGTGKTYLAKAAANYSSKPLILVPPGAFQSTFVGINLLKVWTLFRNVRKLARRYGGVIVFIDEIDSLGNRGGDVSGAEPSEPTGCVPLRPLGTNEPERIVIGSQQMGTLEAFLAAMDGMEEPRGALNRLLVFLGFRPLKPPDYKYLMMGATNMESRLDPALLRAGRFGRKIHVTYPKIEGRLRTYEGYLARVKHLLTTENVQWAARSHAQGTGAEIKDIVNEAVLITYRDDSRDDAGVVHFDDLMRAMLWVKFGESDGPFDREDGRWAVAVHEAGHAVAFHYLNSHRQRIWFATIEQFGRTGGMVTPTPVREDWLLTRDELLADVQVSLASRVAEEMLLGTMTNGHGGDGQSATNRAAAIVRYGLADQIGWYSTDTDKFRKSQEQVLKGALESVQDLLKSHRADVQSVAELLYERGTISGDEIHDLLAVTS